MKTLFKPFATAMPGKGQTHEPHASNFQVLPGNCSDKTSSEKMKNLPKWQLMPLILLLAFCMATYSNAQTNNYIDYIYGTSNYYGNTTPPSLSTASDNAIYGNDCGGSISTGIQNSIFGNQAGTNIAGGSYNTFIGHGAGVASYGSHNTFIGLASGGADMTGTYNTTLGADANLGATGLNDATAIGSNATASYSDEMVFGDGNVTAWGFGGDVTTAGAVMQVNAGASIIAYLTSGGLWMTSDRKLKENFREVDSKLILDKVMALPITKWNYKREPGLDYIGPMAQDFYAAFNLGNDTTHINQSAPGNIALVAIKELGKETIAMQQQESGFANQIQGLTNQNQALQAQNAQLQSSVSDLQDKYNTMLAEIENLKTLQAQCCGSIGNGATGSNTPTGGSNNAGNSSDGQPSLEQNAPNPFTQNTVINYYLPSSMPNAVITVRTLTGTAIKSFNITSPGAGQVTVTAGTLSPGTYEYDMISNNQIIGSKKMVINGQ